MCACIGKVYAPRRRWSRSRANATTTNEDEDNDWKVRSVIGCSSSTRHEEHESHELFGSVFGVGSVCYCLAASLRSRNEAMRRGGRVVVIFLRVRDAK